MFKTYKGKKIPSNVPEGDDADDLCEDISDRDNVDCAGMQCGNCILNETTIFEEWNEKGRPADSQEDIEKREKEEKIGEITRKIKAIEENTKKNNKKLEELRKELEELHEEPLPSYIK